MRCGIRPGAQATIGAEVALHPAFQAAAIQWANWRFRGVATALPKRGAVALARLIFTEDNDGVNSRV